jgi:ATP-dependent Lon protease
METVISRISSAAKNRRKGGEVPANLPSLISLREQISALRILAEAAQAQPASITMATTNHVPMVPVFQLPVATGESLSADRDVHKREERIRKMLNERGNLRLLGAVTSKPLSEAISELYRSHPNFSAAIDYVIGEEILARQQESAVCGLRLLLVGGPGVGKTDFAMALAKLLGLPSHVVSMSSAQSSSTLAGSETHWGNTKPGMVWESLVQGNVANPIFIIDEIEKAATHWGDPLGALFQLLESKTAATFTDKSVPWLPIDASRINWVATANQPERLHEAIRSRFVEIVVNSPTEASLRALVQSLYANLLAEFGLTERFPTRLSRSAEDALIGGSIRDTKRLLRAALGYALRTDASKLVVVAEAASMSQRRIGFI